MAPASSKTSEKGSATGTGANEPSNFEKKVSELKSKFKEGAIPLAQDYAAFLDLIQTIGKAVGLSDEVDMPKPGMGLVSDKDSKILSVGGSDTIASVEGKVKVKYKDGCGLTFGDGGLVIDTGKSVTTDGGKVEVKYKKDYGLTIDGDGLAIEPGDGVKIGDDGKIQADMKVILAYVSENITEDTILRKLPGGVNLYLPCTEDIEVPPGWGILKDNAGVKKLVIWAKDDPDDPQTSAKIIFMSKK